MSKTDKIYEAPEVRIFDLLLEGAICQASTLENEHELWGIDNDLWS